MADLTPQGAAALSDAQDRMRSVRLCAYCTTRRDGGICQACRTNLARAALSPAPDDYSWTCPRCGWRTRDTRYEQHTCPEPAPGDRAGEARTAAVADVLARWGVRSRHGEWSDREAQESAARDVLGTLAYFAAARSSRQEPDTGEDPLRSV